MKEDNKNLLKVIGMTFFSWFILVLLFVVFFSNVEISEQTRMLLKGF